MRLSDDKVTIDVLHTPLRFTIFTFIFVIIALFIFVFVLYDGRGFEIIPLLIGGAITDIVVGLWPIRLRLDGVGITYRRWLSRKTIAWNDLRYVSFEILPRPSNERLRDRIGDYSAYRDHFTDRNGHGIDRAAIADMMEMADLFSPFPHFRCRMTFMGDNPIVMKTERYDGPSVKEFRAAWQYVNSKQLSYNFEATMTRPHEQNLQGLPQLLKPL